MKNPVLRYLSFVKFSHTIFAMPFALIGFFWPSDGSIFHSPGHCLAK